MKVTRCDVCMKDIIPPKHIFQLETKDTTRYSYEKILEKELCVDCHNKVRKAVGELEKEASDA